MSSKTYNPLQYSFIPVLLEYFRCTTGPVLEMGMGESSTLMLHELCRNRGLVSYEDNLDWYQRFAKYKTPWHETHLVEDWDAIDIEKPWDLAFVDHAPAIRRRFDITRLRHHARFIVVHDTEPGVDRFYRYRPVFADFKYQRTFDEVTPWTTVLSMTVQP